MRSLYLSVKGIVERYHLDAFTLNCFDLIPTTHTTGCVALALLNQEGIPAGCEGDEQTLLTMLAVQAATSEMTFMANPSKILDNAAHEMVFAHCTIAPAMTDRYIVRDHYESLSGVAVEGIFDPMDMTVVKCGGKSTHPESPLPVVGIFNTFLSFRRKIKLKYKISYTHK